MTPPARPVDVDVRNYGSIVGFRPVTAAARDWFEDHAFVERWQWLHGTLFVDPRCAPAIVDGLVDDGLSVGQEGRRGERGAVLLLVALLLPALLAFAGLVIDTGWYYVARAEVQNAADAAALAGAVSLLRVDDEIAGEAALLEATAAADAIGRVNRVCGGEPAIAATILSTCPPSPVHGRQTCVRVEAARACPTLVLSMVRIASFRAAA